MGFFAILMYSENFDEDGIYKHDPLSEKQLEPVEIDEEKRSISEELANRIGMDPLDTKLQEGVYLAKHIEKCRICSMVWSAANEITSSHARENEI